MTDGVGFAQGIATAVGRPGMSGRSFGVSGPNVAISTLGAFTQFRTNGAMVNSAFYGTERVLKAYYDRVLVARFAFQNKGAGASDGVATVSGGGNSLATQGRGTSNGAATVAASSTSLGNMIGSSAGSCSVLAVTPGVTQGAGTVTCSSTVVGDGATNPMAFVFSWNTPDNGSVIVAAHDTTSPNRRTWTLSLWFKTPDLVGPRGFTELCGLIVDNDHINDVIVIYSDASFGTFEYDLGEQLDEFTAGGQLSINTWTHIVVRMDTTNSTADDRIRLYKNGSLISDSGTQPVSNFETNMFVDGCEIAFGATDKNFIIAPIADTGKIAFMDLVEGASLDPSEFAFNNSGTWTRKKYAGSYGTHGFGLDGSVGLSTTYGKSYLFTAYGVAVALSGSDMPPFTN